MLDPIAELVRDLDEYGRPAMAWIVRWSAGGVDPVTAAWRESRDVSAMHSLLVWRRNAALEESIEKVFFTDGRTGAVYWSRGFFRLQGQLTATEIVTKSGERIQCYLQSAADRLRELASHEPALADLFLDTTEPMPT